MDENKIHEKLEKTLESQELDYSLDIDDDYIIISVLYQDQSFPKLGSELDEIFEDNKYMIEKGDLNPETNLPGYRSRTFTLKPIED